MIQIPNEINYCEVYLTLRCNKNCSYCINKFSSVKRVRSELNGELWVKYLSKINWKDLPITFGGGEPTLHQDFYYILSHLDKDIKVDLLTNLTFDPTVFLYNVDVNRFRRTRTAYKSIRVSYHPSNTDPHELLFKAEILQAGGFPIGIFGINHPDNLEANTEMSELARQHQIYFFIKDYLGDYNGKLQGVYKYPEGLIGNRRPCLCQSKELLIGPEGKIYRCHKYLYEDLVESDTIKSEELNNIYKVTTCNLYGNCNPCDLKLKTNRFLQAGQCSVEIHPE